MRTHAQIHTHTLTQRLSCKYLPVLTLPVCMLSGGAHDVTLMSRRALTSVWDPLDV